MQYIDFLELPHTVNRSRFLPVGKVNISETTYKLLTDTSAPLSVRGQFSFESRGKIKVKAKRELEMFFVKV